MKWNLQQIFRTSGSLWRVLFSLLSLLLLFTSLSCTNDINQQEINDDLAYRMAYYFNEFALLVSGNGTYSVNITDNTSTDLTGVLIGNGSDIDSSLDITPYVISANTTTSGKIEIATPSELDSGTDNTRAITPYSFTNSKRGQYIIQILMSSMEYPIDSNNGTGYFYVTDQLDGLIITDVIGALGNPSWSGTPQYRIYNITQATNILSTDITIDVNEYTSETASTPPVIDTDEDDLTEGDIIRIDKVVNGLGEYGDLVILILEKP